VIIGPARPPISRDPTVVSPLLLIVVEAIVPSVFVPVEDVKPVAKVETPRMLGIVAVLIVAVEIVAVPADSVPIVAVPVEAVKLVPKVAGPDANSVPIVAVPVDAVKLVPKVTAPVSVDAPSTENDPVLLTPEVDKDNAEDVLSPSVITCNAPSSPPVLKVLISCAKLLLIVCVPSVGI
jgi:hypothetical protein